MALCAGVVAWFALDIPELGARPEGELDVPADVVVAPPEPLG